MPFIPEGAPTPGNLQETQTPDVAVPTQNAVPQLQQITNQPVSQASDIATEEKQKTDAAVTSQAYAHLVQFKNDSVYGQNGVLTKKGQDAFNLTQTMAPAWQKGVDDITSNLTPEQKQQLLPAIKDEGTQFNTLVAQHEHDERQNYFVSSSENLIKNLQDDAIQNYQAAPEKVNFSITQQLAELQKLKTLNGWSQDEFINQARTVVNQTHDGVIERLLGSNQYPAAQQYFADHQGEITGPVKADIVSKLRQGQIAQESVTLEKQLGTTYALPGGHVDLNKIDADVMALPGYSDAEKQTIASNVKGQAYERIRGNEQLLQSQNNDFMNSMQKAKQGGMSLADFQGQIAAMGGDAETMAKRTTMANKLWAPGSVDADNKALVAQLQAQVINGNGDPRADLEKAWNNGNGQISTKTYHQLQSQISDFIIKGPPGEAQQAWGDITKMANQKFGFSGNGSPSAKPMSTDASDFMYYIYQHSQGKIDTDLKDFAKKELSSVPSQNFNVWKSVNEYNQSKGITRNWYTPGNDDATVNAVKSIQAGGQPVTPAMIDWVLKKAPDGKY